MTLTIFLKLRVYGSFIVSLIVTYIKLIGMVSNTKFDIGFMFYLGIFLFYYVSFKIWCICYFGWLNGFNFLQKL